MFLKETVGQLAPTNLMSVLAGVCRGRICRADRLGTHLVLVWGIASMFGRGHAMIWWGQAPSSCTQLRHENYRKHCQTVMYDTNCGWSFTLTEYLTSRSPARLLVHYPPGVVNINNCVVSLEQHNEWNSSSCL